MTGSTGIRHLTSFGYALLFCLGYAGIARAQFHIQPQLGIQTFAFFGKNAASGAISPVTLDRNAALGGGISGAQPGIHAGLELIPSNDDVVRYPISLDVFFLTGQTSFAVSDPIEPNKQRVTFSHTANIISFGAGVKTSLFTYPSLYMSAEARMNYIPHSRLNVRQYYLATDETLAERNVVPDSANNLRFGLYGKVGTQVQFFEPFAVDFSFGLGIVNLFGKNTDPVKQRNLLIIDNKQHDPEGTLLYFGLGISVIYKL